METKVVAGFGRLLQNTKTFDPALNAYLIRFIQELGAVDELREIIENAFEENRIDEDIFSLDDLEEDEFDDELDDDYDFDGNFAEDDDE